MGCADLHLHTSMSDGMMDIHALLDHVQEQTDLDVIAVTDHEDISGGVLAHEIAQKHGYRFQVIVGAEITTIEGHLLALFLERQVPRLQGLDATLKAIHRQGGIAIAPHPMSWLTFSIGERSLRRVHASTEEGVYLDAIETRNPSVAGKVTRVKVDRLNTEVLNLAETGGSDAHFLAAVGTGYTTFPGKTAHDLKVALLKKTTAAAARELSLSEIGYTELVKQQVKSLVIHPTRTVGRPFLRFFRGDQS